MPCCVAVLSFRSPPLFSAPGLRPPLASVSCHVVAGERALVPSPRFPRSYEMSSLFVVLTFAIGSLAVFAQEQPAHHGNDSKSKPTAKTVQSSKDHESAVQPKTVIVGNAKTVGADSPGVFASSQDHNLVGNSKTVGGDRSYTHDIQGAEDPNRVGNSKTVGGN